MKLIINNIRNITKTFELKNLNVFSGSNGSGKSTTIQLIEDMLKGKTSIKEGSASLEIDGKITNINNGVIFNSPGIQINTLGFLSGKGKQIKGYNSTKQDKRNTVFNLLGIEPMKGDISGLTGELRDLKVKESTLMDELLELESKEYTTIDKPKEVKLVQGNIGNKHELDKLIEMKSNIIIDEVPKILDKPKEVKLVQGNKYLLDRLNNELDSIILEGKNIPSKCDKCNQDIVDAEAMKEALRIKYNKKLKEINEFKLELDNKNEYELYRTNLELYNQSIDRAKNIELINKEKRDKLISLTEEINNFKLIEPSEGNQEEYEAYQLELREYETYKNNIKIRSDKIKELKDKIKDIPTVEIQSKITKYRKDELEFNKELEGKLTIGDIKIITMKQLASPNAAGEAFANDFGIEYKGKDYNNLSSGEQIFVDIKVNELLFPDSQFIIIDNAEISTENLKLAVTELKDKTVFVTRISEGDLILTYKLGKQ